MSRNVLIIVFLGLFLISLISPLCQAFSNPAAKFCTDQDNSYKIINDVDGNERGICITDAGIEMDEWDYFRDNDQASIPQKQVLDMDSTGELTKQGMSIRKSTFSGMNQELDTGLTTFDPILTSHGPDLNWKNYLGFNWLSPVKNQGNCGSCWAFSTLAVVEADVNINLNHNDYNLDLSEQDLVSCSGAGNCGGGDLETAIESTMAYIKNTGVVRESCFGYTASNNNCNNKCANWNNEIIKIGNYGKVSADADAIKEAIANYGPINAYMITCQNFNTFSGTGTYNHPQNVYSDVSCFNGWPTNLNGHSVSIVGYSDSGQYWIIKNSWGAGWGDQGYAKIAYNQSIYDINDWWDRVFTAPHEESRVFFLDDSYVITSTDIDMDEIYDKLDCSYGDECDVCPESASNDADNDGYCAGSSYKAPKMGANDCNDNDANTLPPSNCMNINRSMILCPGTYTFPDGIIVSASNSVLDCGGAMFIGSGTGNGIFMDGLSNVIMKNCSVTQYYNGIWLQNCQNNVLIDNKVHLNTNGFYLIDSNDNSLINNSIHNNLKGLELSSNAANNNFWNNNIYDQTNNWKEETNNYCINNLSNHYYGFYGPSCPTQINSYSPFVDNFNINEPNNQSFNITFLDANQPPELFLKFYINSNLMLNTTVFKGNSSSSRSINGSNYSLSLNYDYDSLNTDFIGGYWSAGNYTVLAEISDGYESSQKEWYMVVNNTPRTLHWLHSFQNLTLDEDTSVAYDVNASESDNGTVVYSVKSAKVSIDSNTGMITFIPVQNWFGNLFVTVTASDGIDGLSGEIGFLVNPVNDAPIIHVLSNMTINVTNLVDVKPYFTAYDVDNDPLTFYYAQPLDADGLWQTTMDDVGVYDVPLVVSDGLFNASETIGIRVLNASDFDNDGIPDFKDTDNDNDGINDDVDRLIGNADDIVSSTIDASINIAGSSNLSQVFNETRNITIWNNGFALVEFQYDFGADMLNLRQVKIEVQDGGNVGSIIIEGIELQGSNTKTVYIDNLDDTAESVCIKEAPISSINEISGGCNGADEYMVNCPGENSGYACSLTNNNERYRITGLQHSGVIEQGYCGDGIMNNDEACDGSNLNGNTCASFGYSTGDLVCLTTCTFDKSNCANNPPSLGSGGGGGGGGGGGANMKNLNWNCEPWSPCVNGKETQNCTSKTRNDAKTTNSRNCQINQTVTAPSEEIKAVDESSSQSADQFIQESIKQADTVPLNTGDAEDISQITGAVVGTTKQKPSLGLALMIFVIVLAIVALTRLFNRILF